MKVTGGFSETLEFLPCEILTTIKKYAQKKSFSPLLQTKEPKEQAVAS